MVILVPGGPSFGDKPVTIGFGAIRTTLFQSNMQKNSQNTQNRFNKTQIIPINKVGYDDLSTLFPFGIKLSNWYVKISEEDILTVY